MLAARAWYDWSPGDSPQVQHDDSKEIYLTDGYVQWESGRWLFRLGQQQVVWGETFGTSYSDFVNPKDLRWGLPLELSQSRRSSPMANMKFFAGHFSIQALYLPQPRFSVLPLPGSDYLPDLKAMTGFPEIQVNRETSLRYGQGGGEWGGRMSTTLGRSDLSVYFLHYYDRMPFYGLNSASTPARAILDEHHSRVSSAGFSVATDLGGYIARGEIVYTGKRDVAALTASGLSSLSVYDLSDALSVDFPTWGRLNFSLQWSESAFSAPGEYLLRSQREQYVSAHALLGILNSSALESVITRSVKDSGTRVQLELKHPWSSRVESKLGAECYVGSSESEFGAIRHASQGYGTLKIFLF